MTNVRDAFLDAAREYGKPEITRNEILEIANNAGLKTPYWFMKDEYRSGKGTYLVPGISGNTPKAVAPKAVAAPMAKVVESESSTETQVTKKIKLASVNGDVENFIPNINKLYVKYGHFNDLKKIISSQTFYPVYIYGITGNGKTLLVEQICAELKREFFRVNITAETDEDSLFGGFRLVDGETVWFDGPVVKAMQHGGVLLLDEIDLSSSKCMCLQPVLEGKGVFLKRVNRQINPAKGFTIIATGNTKGKGSDDGKYIGTNVLNEAFLERFPIMLEQQFPNFITEKTIIERVFHYAGVSNKEFCEELAKWSETIRATYALEDSPLDDIITTRRLVHIANAFVIFGDKRKSIEFCLNRFEPHVKESFIELFDKLFSKEAPQPTTPQEDMAKLAAESFTNLSSL